ncbi:MAG TPA: ATP-binding protein [Gemmatimonas sp.]|nr:ATP-binding protein [Gemmatimonas sp.]
MTGSNRGAASVDDGLGPQNGVLTRIGRVLVDAPSHDSLFEGLARILHEDFGADGVALYEANAQGFVRLEFEWDAGPVGVDDVRHFGDQAIRSAVDRGEAIFDERLVDDPAGSPGATALLPLFIGGSARGLLGLRYSKPRVFPHAERALLADVSTQVALAFRNAIQFGELRRRADRLAALARAQQQLTHVASGDALPLLIADAVRGVIQSAVCDIFATTRHGLKRVLTMREGVAVVLGEATSEERMLAEETSATGVSRCVAHLAETAYWSRGAVELCAAVRFGTRTSGVLRLMSTNDQGFDPQDLDLLTILARQAGSAVETSRLFTLQELQRQRAEGAAELARVTLQAAGFAEGATGLLRVLDRFVPSIGKAIGVARGRDGVIEYVATSGTLDVLLGHRPPPGSAISGITPLRRPIEIADLSEIAAPAAAESLPEEWCFVVPLAARDRTLGVLVTTAARGAPLSGRDRITLERLSSSLALALDALLLDDEERLAREREQLLATALTTIDHPIFILDRMGVRYANPAAAREYGWSQAELMEMHFEQLVARIETRPERRANAAFVEAGMSLAEHVHRRRDGSEFPAAVTVSSLASHDGDHIGQVVSVRNVSTDRHMAEQLRNTEKMVALGELVAGVAHEIANPLTGISAFAQMLLEERLEDDQRESVRLIKQESDRAKSVIRDLLIFARTTEPGSGPVDVNDLIEQALRLRAYPLRNTAVEVVLQLDPGTPRVRGDSQKLQQVLLNVIGNAEFAMHAMPLRRLLLRTRAEPGLVHIEAIDTGTGMRPDVRRRIFEPFFTTKKEGVGTGLGLSVSYGIVHAHGGTIDVRSEAGVGTTVTISLPAAE